MLPGLHPAVCLFFAAASPATPMTADQLPTPAIQVAETCQESRTQPDALLTHTIHGVDVPLHHLLRTRHTV